MRVALVASLVAPIRRAEANGPHSIIVDLAHGLAARGHDITVYAADGSLVDGVVVRHIGVERHATDAAVRAGGSVPVEAKRALRRGFQLLYARLRRDAPDVVSQHAFDAPAIELAEGLAVLHTLHLPPADDVVAAARKSSAPLAAVSQTARGAWERAGVPISHVLRNGVPPRAVAEVPVAPTALIAGRISPEKGTHLAIRAARKSGLSPLVVGDVYDSLYFASEVERLLEAGEFIGPVTRPRLFELMTTSAVLLMPVLWDEPFGLVAAEAQMAGCPVVAYDRGALAEVVPNGVGGYLVQPDDEMGLVAASRRALGLDRTRIRARAQLRLGSDAMVDAYEAVLQQLSQCRHPLPVPAPV